MHALPSKGEVPGAAMEMFQVAAAQEWRLVDIERHLIEGTARSLVIMSAGLSDSLTGLAQFNGTL
jgi:hypothetical protein